jgi:HEAT repeat protein
MFFPHPAHDTLRSVDASGVQGGTPPRTGALLVLVLAVLTFGCGPTDPAGDTVKQIIDELAVQRFGTATARYRQFEELVLSPAAAPAWRRGMEHEDPTVREWSVDALARIGLPEDVPVVVAALDDPFRNVQEAAARSLVDLDPEVAAGAFIDRLTSEQPLVQTIAAQGLADLGDEVAVEPLIERLVDPATDSAVRRVVAQSLAAIGDARAVAPLAALAGDDGVDTGLRRDAAEALSTFDTEEALAAFRALLNSDDPYVQEIARRAIAARR